MHFLYYEYMFFSLPAADRLSRSWLQGTQRTMDIACFFTAFSGHCRDLPWHTTAVPAACNDTPRHASTDHDIYHGMPRNDYRDKAHGKLHGMTR